MGLQLWIDLPSDKKCASAFFLSLFSTQLWRLMKDCLTRRMMEPAYYEHKKEEVSLRGNFLREGPTLKSDRPISSDHHCYALGRSHHQGHCWRSTRRFGTFCPSSLSTPAADLPSFCSRPFSIGQGRRQL